MEIIQLLHLLVCETICDAWACWSGWNFGPNPTEYPYSVVTWYRIPPQMRIVRESKSGCPRIPPQWKLSESPNPSVPDYPPMKIVRESKSECPRISPKMKIVRESKSKCPRIPPNENCQRVKIPVSQNTPPMKIVRESKSQCPRIPPPMKIVRESKSQCPRIPPQNEKLSESPNPSVPEYPPNENCQRVQILVFQNTPHPPKMKIVRVQIPVSQITPPPKSEKLQISNFRIVLQSRRSYVETNL